MLSRRFKKGGLLPPWKLILFDFRPFLEIVNKCRFEFSSPTRPTFDELRAIQEPIGQVCTRYTVSFARKASQKIFHFHFFLEFFYLKIGVCLFVYHWEVLFRVYQKAVALFFVFWFSFQQNFLGFLLKFQKLIFDFLEIVLNVVLYQCQLFFWFGQKCVGYV